MARSAGCISIAPERFDENLLADVAQKLPELTARSLPDASVEDDGVGDPVSDDETDIGPTTAAYKVKLPRRPVQIFGLDRTNSPHPRGTQTTALSSQEAKVEDADILAIPDRTMPTAQIMQFAVKPPGPPEDDGRWTSILPPPPTEV